MKRDPVKGCGSRPLRQRDQAGQATVELAVLVQVVVLLLLATLQVAMLVGDRVRLVNAARAAGRAVVVSPRLDAAEAAVESQSSEASRISVSLDGDTSPGGLATVTLKMPARRAPLVGRLVSGVVLAESLTVLVE